MDYVIDTNILVYFIRNDAYIHQLDQELGLFAEENAVFLSIVSIGEIRSLAFQLGWAKNKFDRMKQFLHALPALPVDGEEISSAYADLDAYSQGRHPLFSPPSGFSARNMGKNDLWIAATAKILNATLLTTDHDFDHLSADFIPVKKVVFR